MRCVTLGQCGPLVAKSGRWFNHNRFIGSFFPPPPSPTNLVPTTTTIVDQHRRLPCGKGNPGECQPLSNAQTEPSQVGDEVNNDDPRRSSPLPRHRQLTHLDMPPIPTTCRTCHLANTKTAHIPTHTHNVQDTSHVTAGKPPRHHPTPGKREGQCPGE